MGVRRGITPVVAVVLLLMMTVGAAGGAYTWITTTTGEAQREASEDLGTRLTVRDAACGGRQALVTLANTGDRAISGDDADIHVHRDGDLVATGSAAVGSHDFTAPGGVGRVRFNVSAPFEGGYTHRLELTFAGGSYTTRTTCTPAEGPIAVRWDRENDGDTLQDFEDRMVNVTNSMGEWDEESSLIRWSQAGTSGDKLKYRHDIPHPNTGNVTLRLKFTGSSYEGSGVAFWVEDSAGNAHLPSNGTNRTCDEDSETPDPFTCTQDEDGTFTWDDNWTVDAPREIDRFYIASDHNDCCFDGGDSSDLYRFTLWVR